MTDFCLYNIDSKGLINKAFEGYRFRPDFVSKSSMIVVEFDGYQHYTNPDTILRDYNKDKILSDLKYTIVQIPYFVQLERRVIDQLFNKFVPISSDYKQNYPHSFIDKSVVLPAAFCSLGIERYNNDLKKFKYISDEIETSLENKVIELKDRRLVYPICT